MSVVTHRLRDVFEEGSQSIGKIARRQLAFPDHHHRPAVTLKFLNLTMVARYVCVKLCVPEFDTRLGSGCLLASRVAMPETTVNEDDLSARRKHDIGCARQPATIDPETIAESMDNLPDLQLRGGVLLANPRHERTTFRRMDVVLGCVVTRHRNVALCRGAILWISQSRAREEPEPRFRSIGPVS